MDRNPWIRETPHPKQRQFLLLGDVREAFYGGAGGGGKSQALLYGALQYVDVPGYAALILRRNYVDLALPKSLMHRSREYLAGVGAAWNGETHALTFPSGATITFGHANHPGDEQRYRSAEFQYIAFDELTEFEEAQYRFLFTRLRRPVGLPIPLRMRSASNPGGVGHGWVKSRFVDPRSRVAGSVFVPARIADNPSLDQEEYRASLAHTDPITRRQIEDGDWDAYQGGRFRREWLRYYQRHGDGYRLDGRHVAGDAVHNHDPWAEAVKDRFLTVDSAASVKESADYTVISAWGLTRRHELLWLDCVRGRWEVPDILPQVERQYVLHRASFVGIEAVAGHSGMGLYQQAKRTRMAVRALSPKGKDKLVRATPAIILAEAGRLWLPAARPPWVEEAEAELLRFTGDEKQDAHDDIVDTLAYAALIVTGHDDQKAGFRPYVVPT